MISDAGSVADHRTLEADVCIIGAGPAGMTLARELADRDVNVCLLESGGLELDPDIQTLSEAETTGLPYDLAATRVRRFGGASNIWVWKPELGTEGVRLRRLDPHDLEARDWVPHSGWPFGMDELLPFYDRAEAMFGLDPMGDRSDGGQGLDSDESVFEETRFRFGRSDLFTQSYRTDIQRAQEVSAYVGGTVTRLETNLSGERVTSVRVATLPGGTFSVAATKYVLAAGGIENARLLLASDRVLERGIGNEHDLVGRFFMEHPGGRIGLVVPADAETIPRLSVHVVDDPTITRRVALRAPVLARERLLHCAMGLTPIPSDRRLRYLTYRRPPSSAVVSAQALHRALRRLRRPERSLRHIRNVLLGLDEVALAGTARARWKAAESLREAFGSRSCRRGEDEVLLAVEAMSEQVPNPDSRLTLSNKRDALGMPRVRLHWELTPLDIRTLARTQTLLLEQIERAGLGKGYPGLELEAKPAPRLTYFHHHMGTTRMDADPRSGVVDEHCRVHSVENLFVAGSSVFPTVGYANPTLTVVALALRLADHLVGEVVGRPARTEARESSPA